MPIKNYSTSIDCSVTVGEIQSILAQHGAQRIMIEYQDGIPENLMFEIQTKNDHLQAVRLPANVDKAWEVLKREKIQAKFQTYEHAQRVSWRILKDWLTAQLALLEIEMVTFDQIMLPYFCNREGKTLYEIYNQGNLMIEG